MKYCLKCHIFFQEQIMACERCRDELNEVSLSEALSLTQKQSLKTQITGKKSQELSDSYKQYHVRCFLENRSLFLDYDLHKNRLKHSRRIKHFFIAPLNITGIINIPWFLFNLISSNLFHLQYLYFCPRCQTKFIKGKHSQEECDYNIEYFKILDDILNGQIVERKVVYEEYAKEKRKHGLRSAYHDLFCRHILWEGVWDLLSVGLSVLFWLYIAVNISWPMFQVLLQKMQQIEAYEINFLVLR